MRCAYFVNDCLHNIGGDCDITTCYDEYDMAEGKPYPNEDVKEYWAGVFRQNTES